MWALFCKRRQRPRVERQRPGRSPRGRLSGRRDAGVASRQPAHLVGRLVAQALRSRSCLRPVRVAGAFADFGAEEQHRGRRGAELEGPAQVRDGLVVLLQGRSGDGPVACTPRSASGRRSMAWSRSAAACCVVLLPQVRQAAVEVGPRRIAARWPGRCCSTRPPRRSGRGCRSRRRSRNQHQKSCGSRSGGLRQHRQGLAEPALGDELGRDEVVIRRRSAAGWSRLGFAASLASSAPSRPVNLRPLQPQGPRSLFGPSHDWRDR